MPSTKHQIVIRVTDEQLAWIIAESAHTTQADFLLTELGKRHADFAALPRVRQWTRKPAVPAQKRPRGRPRKP